MIDRVFSLKRLDSYFQVTSRGSTFATELVAGMSTFLALAYIAIVNPAILSQGGFDKSAVFFATIAVSATATIAMGVWARLPYALAPGLEMDAYVAFFIVGTLNYTTGQALGIVFWSTVIFFVLTFLSIREKIVKSIPRGMKHALSAAVGVFVALIGFKLSGLIEFEGTYPIGFGDPTSPQAGALYIGLVTVVLCEFLKFRASVLVSIVVASVYCSVQGLADNIEPIELSWQMLSLVGELDLSVIWDPASWAPILILFLIDFYGSVAKIVGLSVNTSLYDESRDQPFNTGTGLLVDGWAAFASPIVGTSSVTTFVESAVGIKVGGRTGITAIVCGLFMLSMFYLAPLVNYVPVLATSGALVAVGYWLLPRHKVRETFKGVDWITALVMAGMAAVSFSLEKAMLAGYLLYFSHSILYEKKCPNIYFTSSFLLLAIGVLLRFLSTSGS